ncbi:hypothetical protein EV426DRAFT_596790 [Tirmania nivea]|nr:hypothetical protein EV426DRAFT_596790 [Tirmania nivea]
MIQLLNSCPDLFRSTSFGKSSFRSRSLYRFPRSRGNKYSSYKKLLRYNFRLEDCTSSTELQSPGITDSSFTLLANLQLSVSAFSTELSCINTSTLVAKSKPSPSQSTLSSIENNPVYLRKQGRLALTFALRKYGDISSEERIALANEIEEAIDRIYLGSQYRENIYFVGGLLAEDGAGEEIVVKLVNKKTTIGDLLMWSVKSDEWEKQPLV